MATASSYKLAVDDVLERLRAATAELAHAADAEEVAEMAAELLLGLTHSSQSVVALEDGSRRGARRGARYFSRAATSMRSLKKQAVAELLTAAKEGTPTTAQAQLVAGGEVIGTMAVSRASAYADADRQALDIFASTVAAALGSAEKLRSAHRLEHTHEMAVEVILAMSSQAASGRSMPDFYRQLSETLGELVDADKVLFWRLRDGHLIAPLDAGFGIERGFLSRLAPTRCEPGSDDLASRVVFDDLIFRANAADPPEFAYVLEALGVTNAMSVAWRAGEERLGLVAAYDSKRPGGFTREDAWVLQKAGLAAGLVTQLRRAQDDLSKSVERLTKVDSARQLLLKNMSTVVDKERKRFVSELHNDALQKLTAAELHLGRLAPGGNIDASTLDAARQLLEDTEVSLRRLVFEVRPPALESPDGLEQSIRDRVAMLGRSGIKCQLELDLPSNLNLDVRSMVFRQVAEAIGNVERHSGATLVKISLTEAEGGVVGVIRDNGRGFVVAERSNLPGHLGLLGLRERALMAGGRYKIESEPGAGTRIEFWVPLSS